MSDPAVHEFLESWRGVTPLPGAPWFAPQRTAAQQAFHARGFPTLRDEDWKYTDVRAIASRRFGSGAGMAVDADLAAAASFAAADAHELLFLNGQFAPATAATSRLPAGVLAMPISVADARHNDSLSAHLGRYADINKHGFVALNTALAGDGALIFIPDDVEVTIPISLLFASAAGPQPTGTCPRNLIILGHNAAATVIECYTGADGGEYLTNAVTEVRLGAGARLEHYRLQQEGNRAYHLGNLSVLQDQDSRLVSHAFALGAVLARNEIDVRLAARGAQVSLNGLYVAGERQHLDNHTRIDHEQPHTTSAEHYRGVLTGRARAVFNGKVVVHKDAQKSDARQVNANLLLSDDAEVDTKPELEIYADDVKCSHGATIGRLDDNMLFYLRTRAIPEAVARSLLIYAFADAVIQPIGFAPIRARLEQRVLGRLPDAEVIREFVQ
jgi:Fe-S cluster assembly protein SufD